MLDAAEGFYFIYSPMPAFVKAVNDGIDRRPPVIDDCKKTLIALQIKGHKVSREDQRFGVERPVLNGRL